MRPIALTCLAAAVFVAAACHTSHDIHITLDIRHLESQVAEPRTVADAGGQSVKPLVAGARPAQAQWDNAAPTAAKPGTLKPVVTVEERLTQSLNKAGIDATPAVLEAMKRREGRANQIQRLKQQGEVGENNAGLLQALKSPVRPTTSVPVQMENKDRETVYAEVARQKGADVTLIGRLWAEDIRAILTAGQWFQAPAKGAFYQRFLESSLARAFDTPPDPGAWAQVPSAKAM